MARTACGFCGSNEITSEHLFNKKFGALFGAGPGARVQHTFTSVDGADRPPWNSYRFNHQVKMPCAGCNNGWMNRLDTVALPFLTPMVRGRPTDLDITAQLALSTWALKTAMVAEYMKPETSRYFTQDERRSLMDRGSPVNLIGAHVWIARYGSRNSGIHALSEHLARPGGDVCTHISTFALGQFAVQVFVERDAAGYTRDPERLIEIWPPSTDTLIRAFPVRWPPLYALSATEFLALTQRLLGLSAEGGPDSPNNTV